MSRPATLVDHFRTRLEMSLRAAAYWQRVSRQASLLLDGWSRTTASTPVGQQIVEVYNDPPGCVRARPVEFIRGPGLRGKVDKADVITVYALQGGRWPIVTNHSPGDFMLTISIPLREGDHPCGKT